MNVLYHSCLLNDVFKRFFVKPARLANSFDCSCVSRVVYFLLFLQQQKQTRGTTKTQKHVFFVFLLFHVFVFFLL